MLENENKRLIEMQESQLEVNKALLAYLAKQDEKGDSASVKAFADMMQRQAVYAQNEVSIASTGQSGQDIYTHERIVEKGKEYTRLSHPLLFSVVDYLESDNSAIGLGVRVIADRFTKNTGQSVSKSWAAVAKNYWQSKR